jgi:hypothetical protein
MRIRKHVSPDKTYFTKTFSLWRNETQKEKTEIGYLS